MRKRHAARGPYCHLRQDSVLQGMLLGARDNVFGGPEKQSVVLTSCLSGAFFDVTRTVLSGFVKCAFMRVHRV